MADKRKTNVKQIPFTAEKLSEQMQQYDMEKTF